MKLKSTHKVMLGLGLLMMAAISPSVVHWKFTKTCPPTSNNTMEYLHWSQFRTQVKASCIIANGIAGAVMLLWGVCTYGDEDEKKKYDY